MRSVIGIGARICVGSLVLLAASLAHAGIGTAFTYQGRLEQTDGISDGPNPMSFTLWDGVVNGNQIGPTLTFDGSSGNGQPVNIVNSIFCVTLDFGVNVAVINQSKWLEVSVNGQVQQPRFPVLTVTVATNVRGINVGPYGGVGIGTTNTGTFLLAVNGTAANSSGSWSVLSDSRLKKDVREIEPGTLDRLLSLRGVEFEYTDQAVKERDAAAGLMVGFVAQDVEKVFPEWVGCDKDGMRYITERGTTALLVEALRDLRAEKDRQIEELKALHKAELDRVECEKDARIAGLEARLEKLERAAAR